ncbi:MAG: PEP/pyruvate-binding domain-containing protein, partial [Gemmatimonadaceae bacterium]|nr:PEP/pyruvate-binding domain-containing protein [Gemmatimonadaceae bacterium]
MIREAWALLFETSNILYCHQNGIDHLKTKMVVVVQKMIESQSSGVVFTTDPVTSDKNTVIIEAIYGLKELAVLGRVKADQYKVDKKEMKIVGKNIVEQDIMMAKGNTLNKEVQVACNMRSKQKIPDNDTIALAQYAKKLEKHYYFPQDIEWAKENEKIYIIQIRPLTVFSQSQGVE